MALSGAIRAGAAYVELMTRDSKMIKGLASAGTKLKHWGVAVSAVGAGIFGLGAAAATPLLAMAKGFADAGSNIKDMSDRTGLSAEAVSELGHAAEQAGTDVGTLENGVKKMQQNMVAAAAGGKEATKMFTDLGLKVSDLAGMEPDQQFTAIAESISKIQDPAKRTATAMDVFGKAGTSLLPMFADGAAGIAELRGEAQQLGLSWSGKDAKAAEAFGDTLSNVWSAIKALGNSIGGALVPDLQSLAEMVTGVVAKGTEWIKNNQATIALIGRVIAGVVVAGAVIAGLGVMITIAGAALGAVATLAGMFGAAISAIGGVLAFLISPIGLVIAAVVGLGGYFLYASGAAGEAFAFLSGVIGSLVADSKAAFGAIGQALASGNLALAAKILWLTLKMEWKRGIGFLNKYWQDWKAFFLLIANEAVTGLAKFFTNAWAGLQVAWIETVDFLADAWNLYCASMLKIFNTIIGLIKKAWVHLKGLFDADLNVEAEVNRINTETAGKNSGVNDEQNKRIGDRETRRKADEKKIEADRAGAASILESDRARKEKAIIDAQAKAQADGLAEVAAARAEWEGSIGEAAALPPSGPGGPSKPKLPEIPDDNDLSAMADKVSVSGTFNAQAAGSLGTGVQDRIDVATETSAKKLAAIEKKTAAPKFT